MAVAIKKKGFTNIKIYNGGLKDWMKSGLPVNTIEPLPKYKGPVISADELVKKLREAEKTGCRGADGDALLTLIDFRASSRLKHKIGGDRYRIKTVCPTITALLDDFIDNQELIDSIPRKGMVVTISETGNRDSFLKRYLKKYGYTNVVGLQYGMRSWHKAGYPVEKIAP